MKFLFMMSMLLGNIAGGDTQPADNAHYAISELAVSSFKKIVVNANVDVVLVQNDTLKKAIIEGDEDRVPEIAVTVNNGTLTIASGKQLSYRGKVQVTIPVKGLSVLEVNADAGVVSLDPIRSPAIAVSINGLCDLHLKSTGKILVEAEEGYQVEYKELPKKETVITVTAD